MDKHTFLGKNRVGTTNVYDFTDFQGIGRDPLYKRYDNVHSIINRVIDPEYRDFLAAPNFEAAEGTIGWYIPKWQGQACILTTLSGPERARYDAIKNATIAHYRQKLADLNGEELQVMACALRYIDDDFVVCADGKCYLLAWGMTPDANKHIPKGELIHDASFSRNFRLTFVPGEHGTIAKTHDVITLPEGTVLNENDIPAVTVEDGYVLDGWTPEPLGLTVTADCTFTARYSEAAVVPPVIVPPVIVPEPPEPPKPQMYNVRFDAGNHGSLQGENILPMAAGATLLASHIPAVKANKGYKFKGWDITPLGAIVDRDVTFTAQYAKKKPWYRRWWFWLLVGLLALLLLGLLSWLLPGCGCTRCARAVNGVLPIAQRDIDGEMVDDNGTVQDIPLVDGRLPEGDGRVAPIREPNGEMPNIIREPNIPAYIANRLFLFIDNENKTVDDLAKAFKDAYPDDKYSIIGYDRDVKYVVVEIPEDERSQIRENLPRQLEDFNLLVLDEQIMELNSSGTSEPGENPGWHLKAVKAQQGWKITRGSPDVTVAVVDDGIDASHPMFEGRIRDPYNVYTQDNRLSCGTGHGTHVAGIAVGNTKFLDKGAAGIAPDCMLMPVQIFDNGTTTTSAMVSGIMYAINKGAKVINISAGPSFPGMSAMPEQMQMEIAKTQFMNMAKLYDRVGKIAQRHNAVVVFAAGNDDIISGVAPNDRSLFVMAVGAVDKRLYPAKFNDTQATNYGYCTDISAPGSDIFSAFPVGEFQSMGGTSMAAPVVSGVIALMKSLKEDITCEQVRYVLYRTGKDVYGPLPPMVQIPEALDAVKRGDFSRPERRDPRPIPGSDPSVIESDEYQLVGPGGDTFRDDDVTVVVNPGNDDSDEIVFPDEETGNSRGETVVNPGNYTGRRRNPENTPNPGYTDDSEEIRKMIKYHKEQISQLERQLKQDKTRRRQ